jgi:heme-degrading monooxygenase HmoA
MKQVVVVFEAPGATAAQYEGVWNDLRAAGESNPKGLISHVGAAKPDGSWLVVDIWESAEAFKEFSNTLAPIIAKNGLPSGPPMVLPAHYVYIGQPETIPA